MTGPRRVRLLPVDLSEHRRLLVRLLTEPGSTGGRYRGLGPLSPGEAIDQVLRDQVLAQALLVDAGGSALGLVQCLVPSFRHGTAQLGAALAPSAQGSGWPLLGVAAFVDQVFREHRLRKLYLEVAAVNQAAIARGLDRLFRFEGTLSEHEYHDGRYVDVHFYSLHRDSFYGDPRYHRLLRSALR